MVRTFLQYDNEHDIMLERLLKTIRERQRLNIARIPLTEDGEKDIHICWKMISNSSFAKIDLDLICKEILNNKILKDTHQGNIYTKHIHKESKLPWKSLADECGCWILGGFVFSL